MRRPLPSRTAVDPHIFYTADTIDQHFPQPVHSIHIPVQVCVDQFRSPGKTRDARHVFRPGAHTFLLTAAVDDRIHPGTASDIQETNAFRPVDLMRTDGKQINIHLRRMDPELTEALHSIHMKKRLRIAAPDQLSRLRQRLHTPDLIIDMHDRHQDRIPADGTLQILQRYPAQTIHRKISHLKSLPLQIGHRLQDRRMLHPRGDHMPASSVIRHGRTDQRNIVRLRTAGCKKDLLLAYLQQPGQGFSCIPQILFRFYAFMMHAGRISILRTHNLTY